MFNMKSFIKMLQVNYTTLTAKAYLRYIHRFLEKYQQRFGEQKQSEYVKMRKEITVCRNCEGWSGTTSICQCLHCEDFYHIGCLRASERPSKENPLREWICSNCDRIAQE